ncbi:nucleotide exchange factor sil1 [Coemansia nantahalensis]|nr:nucleotide exchange factor sil1 [Coemansia nantahalensis]
MSCIWRVLLLAVAALLACASASPTSGAAADEICTTDAAGTRTCYPRVFVAASEFREILPGQEVPPGLHIQLDMATGRRQARLMAGEGSQEDSALVVVDDPAAPAVEQKGTPDRQVVLGGMSHGHGDRTLELVGSVVDAGSKMADRTAHAAVRAALDELAELVYDPRQAERVVRSPGAVDSLLRLGDPAMLPVAWPTEVRRLASLALGTMVQNNPRLQGAAQRAGAVPKLLAALPQEHDLVAAGRHLFALSSLTRGHREALAQMAALGGLDTVRDLWPFPALVSRSSNSPAEAARFEARVVRFFEDALNPEFTAELPAVVAGFAPGWCALLAARAAGGPAGHRELYLGSLQALHAAYPAACPVPATAE